MALGALILSKTLFLVRFFGLVKKGAPKDFSKPSGSIFKGVRYSCTTAMMPYNKESAYLHLPTFTAGLLFHIGIFTGIAAFVWFLVSSLLNLSTPPFIAGLCCGFLLVTACCGVAILCKRILKKELRSLSHADDYISNALATLLQLVTAGYFCCNHPIPYYMVVTLFFLWLPIGKTRHLLYFFAARFHLGFFYGRRGSWPVNNT